MGNELSIADLVAYQELVQVEGVKEMLDLDNYPNIVRWMKDMKRVPFHDEVHAGVPAVAEYFKRRIEETRDLQRKAKI